MSRSASDPISLVASNGLMCAGVFNAPSMSVPPEVGISTINVLLINKRRMIVVLTRTPAAAKNICRSRFENVLKTSAKRPSRGKVNRLFKAVLIVDRECFTANINIVSIEPIF